MKTYWESGGIFSRILKLSSRWRWVVSFTPWPPYPWYPLDNRLCGPHKHNFKLSPCS